MLGTAGYLAPEQAQGRPITAATDGYALAVVAFELFTGKRPFERDSPTAEATAHAYEPVPSAVRRNPGLPEAVDSVFATALAKDPAARFRSCAAFVSTLHSACSRRDGTNTQRLARPAEDPPRGIIRPRRRRRPALVAGASLVLLCAAGLAGALLADGSSPRPQAASTTTLTRTTTVTAPTTTSTSPPLPAPGASSVDASDLNARGYRLMLSGNYTAALPLLQEAVTGLADPANPVTAYANFNLGQTLVQLGQCSSALPYLQRAAQLEPTRQETRTALRYAERCASQAGQAGDAGPAATPPGTPGHGHGNDDGKGGD